LRVFLYCSQNRARIRFRQVEIEKDETGSGGLFVRRNFAEEPESLFPVRRNRNVNGGLQTAKGLSDEAYVAGVVLHN